jgi:NADPH2:quinone reductase
MRAAEIVDYGGPASLRVRQRDEPTAPTDPATGELLASVRISVHAAGVSFPEVLQSWGKYQLQPPLPFVPGGEISGVVDAAPVGSGFSVGDRVFAYCGMGGFAETAFAPVDRTFALPDTVSFAQGSALFANYHSAYFALVTRGRAVAGESVLIHGAAGGLGTATIQVARSLGLRTIAVVSSDEKAVVARDAGAETVLRSNAAWKDELLKLVPGGVDLVIDSVGNQTIDSLRALRELGRLVIVGFASGEIPSIPANRLLLRNLEAIGVVYGAFAFARPGYSRTIQAALDPLLRVGGINPIIGAVFPLEQAGLALEQLESRRAVGKIVLEVRSSDSPRDAGTGSV